MDSCLSVVSRPLSAVHQGVVNLPEKASCLSVFNRDLVGSSPGGWGIAGNGHWSVCSQ